jgi:mono/diheme cytochrome c family protein
MNRHVTCRDCFPRRSTRSNARPSFSLKSSAVFGFFSLFFASVFACGASIVPADHAERMTKGLEAFDRDVRTLLVDNCLNCHGGEKTKGDFSLADRDALLRGGVDGPSVIAFDAGKSRLLKMLRHEEEPFMPEKKPRLSDDVIAKIAAWLEQGAPYSKPLVDQKKPERDRAKISNEDRQWWSFLPLSRQPVPVGKLPHSVDRFLESKATQHGLEFASRADRRTLIRRAFLDLTGLPPAPEDVERFVADPAPDTEAWPRLVDALLSRPAYGERWARHWMDVARYGESSGFEQDYDRKGSYQYRDFLIRALNADMPFQQFVRWQIAGDEFAPGDPMALAATAFLSLGVFPTQITINELERVRYEDMDDMLSTTGAAFLGLTVGCARCHDHKYDPIPTRDYYRMLSTFTGTVRSEIDLEIYPEETRSRKAAWRRAHEHLLTEQGVLEDKLIRDGRASFETFLRGAISDHPEPEAWGVWRVREAKGSTGTALVSHEDGSWQLANESADGNATEKEIFTFTGPAPQFAVRALRLEALLDERLPEPVVGLGEKGNFQLSRLRAFLKKGDGTRVELSFLGAEADFEQNKKERSVEASIRGDGKGGWSVGGRERQAHRAAFRFAQPIQADIGCEMEVVLEFQGSPRHVMRRPRMSWKGGTRDAALDAPVEELRVVELLALRSAPEKTADVQILERWWMRQNAAWKAAETKRVASLKAEPIALSKVLVASESFPPVKYHTAGGSVETHKETYVLKRGNVALKEDVAAPGFLQVLSRAPEQRWQWTPPEGATYAGRRRALANWILDENEGAGALAARVFVNRVWLHHFGQGLVPTPNDFGKTGAMPKHSELLDYLASQLLEKGGSLKAIHRLLMTSEAYQQEARKDAVKEARDPANELWMRRSPKRLEAEAMRDSLLAVGGLLDPAPYGPGETDENSRRRSIYLRVKRSQLMNSMVSFDQPEPLVSQGLRPTTTVAPQALVLMNSSLVRQCAQGLAERVARGVGPNVAAEELIRRVWLFAFGRPPSAAELSDARAFLAEQSSAGVAGPPSNTPTATNGSVAHPNGFADLCQVLLETNEFAYRP